jgi:hypothetical protein
MQRWQPDLWEASRAAPEGWCGKVCLKNWEAEERVERLDWSQVVMGVQKGQRVVVTRVLRSEGEGEGEEEERGRNSRKECEGREGWREDGLSSILSVGGIIEERLLELLAC